ncbi:MAG: hypothetical protein NTV68_13745 [Methanomicrobiales archaeon]|nr:hypothetical protein [Methanomicrobiales archaeon]
MDRKRISGTIRTGYPMGHRWKSDWQQIPAPSRQYKDILNVIVAGPVKRAGGFHVTGITR